MSDKTRELLEQQVVLLSEQSKKAESVDDLAMLSRAMVEIADCLSRQVFPTRR